MVDGPKNFVSASPSLQKSVIFVVGATATGKSSWAVKMAERYQGVIFNCDSIQVYKGLNVGSAKPSITDYQKVPHFLFDLVSAPETLTTGDYTRAFEKALAQIDPRQPVFLVGGSGFYFQALEKGMYPIGKASEEIRQKVEAELKLPGGPEKLYHELKAKDAAAAEKISPQDHYRLARALEIIRAENKTLTEIKAHFSQQKKELGFRLLKVGMTLPREVLWSRIEERARVMVQAGLRQEVKSLLDQGLQGWAPLSSVGYMQACEAIRENKSDSWLVEAITVATRQLSKKQRTWFKRDQEIFWIEDAESRIKAEDKVRHFLQG